MGLDYSHPRLKNQLNKEVEVPYNVYCLVHLQNNSRFSLTNPCVYYDSGQCYVNGIYQSIPTQIQSKGINGTKSWVFSKIGHTACGACGILSYDLHENQKLQIMWETPYNHDYYRNYFAVGVGNQIASKELYEQFLNKKQFFNSNFNRKCSQDYESIQSLDYYCIDLGIFIKISMTAYHRAELKINIYDINGINFQKLYLEKCHYLINTLDKIIQILEKFIEKLDQGDNKNFTWDFQSRIDDIQSAYQEILKIITRISYDPYYQQSEMKTYVGIIPKSELCKYSVEIFEKQAPIISNLYNVLHEIVSQFRESTRRWDIKSAILNLTQSRQELQNSLQQLVQ